MMLTSGGFSRINPPLVGPERSKTRRSVGFMYIILEDGVGGILSVVLKGTRKVLYAGGFDGSFIVGSMYMRSIGLSSTAGLYVRVRLSDCRSMSTCSGAKLRIRVGVRNEVSVDLEHCVG